MALEERAHFFFADKLATLGLFPPFIDGNPRLLIQGIHVDLPGNELRGLMDEANAAGVTAPRIGRTGGRELKLAGARAISVEHLKAAHEAWFPRFMGD